MDLYEKLDDELSDKPKLDEEQRKENAEMQKTFRKVFSNYDGKKVLNVLLNDLLYFQPTHSEGQQALKNYATYLLAERMGFKDTVDFVDNLLKCKFE